MMSVSQRNLLSVDELASSFMESTVQPMHGCQAWSRWWHEDKQRNYVMATCMVSSQYMIIGNFESDGMMQGLSADVQLMAVATELESC